MSKNMKNYGGAAPIAEAPEDLASLKWPPKSPRPQRSHDTPSMPSVANQIYTLLTDSTLNVLLLFVPIAFACQLFGASNGMIFGSSFFMLIPLAALLGTLTEDIALQSNASIAALINVTFGNATELIISLVALRAGAFDVIRYSLVGSVLGNMLLVLGSAFIASGMRSDMSDFNIQAVNVYGSVLMCTTMSFVIPSAFQLVTNIGDSGEGMLTLSRELAVVSASMYVTYLVFQLVTHKTVFDDPEENDDDNEEPQFSFWVSVVGIAVVGILISVGSDWIVDNLEGTARDWHLGKHFIGVILIPIVGNAAEHTSAVTSAYKGKLDISFGIAIGSSIQISSFVVPFMVLFAWMIGQPLSMNFHPFSTIVMFVSVIILNNLTTTGKTHWLNGVMLLCAYTMVAIAYLHIPNTVVPMPPMVPIPTRHA